MASAGTTFSSVRLRLLGWAARRFAGQAGAMSFGGTLSMLPDSSLFPLFRDGLDPVAEVGRLREQVAGQPAADAAGDPGLAGHRL